MKIKIITGLLLFVASLSSGQEIKYRAGFRIIRTYDSSRTFRPNSTIADKLYYRPIDIDIWYPAQHVLSDTTASFTYFVNLLEFRSNFYGDTKTYTGLSDELLQYICAGFDCPDYHVLKTVRTDTYVTAKPIQGQFPLVVYMAGLNGMSYENYVLFENLAKEGFVVASVSSIGRYPGNMSMDLPDLFEQINDANFIINYLFEGGFISDNIALVGYSWGGLAASIMSMLAPLRFKAVVSLNGSEQFQYLGREEDEKINRIRKSVFFRPQNIKSPYLYIDRDIIDGEDLADSIYNITNFIKGDKNYLKIKGATHEDFSCLNFIYKKERGNYQLIQQLTINYLLDKIKHEDAFNKNIPEKEVIKYFSLPVPKHDAEGSTRILSGSVRDSKSNQPLPYVNVGILNGDRGTTTNVDGLFGINISSTNADDTLKISMVGYEPNIIFLKDILKQPGLHLNIRLVEKIHELKEIIVSGKRSAIKVFGNKTESKFFGGKFASNDLGSEIGIKIRIRKASTYIDKLTVNISYNTSDTAIFRVNVYTVKNGLPDRNLLDKNIFLKIGRQTGRIELDLSRYNIIVNDDFFISLEWIGGNNNSGIVFSSGFINKGTYYRKASQARWKKYPVGVGFNVTTSTAGG